MDQVRLATECGVSTRNHACPVVDLDPLSVFSFRTAGDENNFLGSVKSKLTVAEVGLSLFVFVYYICN